jgi:hypothetical protein
MQRFFLLAASVGLLAGFCLPAQAIRSASEQAPVTAEQAAVREETQIAGMVMSE